jgi:hypothetical protein
VLHALTSESKKRPGRSVTSPAPMAEHALQPHPGASPPWARAVSAGAGLPSSPGAALQRTLGNQAVLRMINAPHTSRGSWGTAMVHRKCASGGTESKCTACHDESRAFLQASVMNRTESSRVPPLAPTESIQRNEDITLSGQMGPSQRTPIISSTSGLGDVEVPSEEQAGPGETEPIETGGTPACPVTAVFSSTLAGTEKATCQVPTGKNGVSKLARFVVHGLPDNAGSVTIGEQFQPLEDPYGVFAALKPNTFTTSGRIFDDCYLLATDKQLPDDFMLKVEQNHLLNKDIISRNQITYRLAGVSFCHYDRKRGSCDFGGRCKL